jgi:hypothetical protein
MTLGSIKYELRSSVNAKSSEALWTALHVEGVLPEGAFEFGDVFIPAAVILF